MPLGAAAAAATAGPTRFPTTCRCGDPHTSMSGRHTSGGCSTASPGSCYPWRWTAAATGWCLLSLWRLFLANQRLSATAAISLEVRVKPAVTTWSWMVTGSLLMKCVLNNIPSGSPGGSKASISSISWEGLLSPRSPLLMIFWHWSSSLGVKRSSSRIFRAL